MIYPSHAAKDVWCALLGATTLTVWRVKTTIPGSKGWMATTRAIVSTCTCLNSCMYCFFFSVQRAIDIVSDKIGSDWKGLARKLGFEKTDIDGITYQNPSDLRECIYCLFSQWQQREGSRTSVRKLVNGLLDAKLGAIANEVSTKILGTVIVN